MKKTTTNTTRETYDLAAIMRRAWAIRKACAAECGCKVSEIVWGECLKMAWAEAYAEIDKANAGINAATVIGEWEALGEAGQVKMMTACVRKAAKNEIGYSTEDHYLQFSEVPAWFMHGHDFDEFISETWLRAFPALDVDKLTARNEERASQYKRPITLVSIVYNAARASIASVYEQDMKHERARCVTVIGEDGEEYSYFDTIEASAPDNTERSALLRVTVGQFAASRDEIDRKIMEQISQGYTERQIGKSVGMSGPAVHKRIVKMRKALRELVA